MNYREIDIQNWNRKEHYLHFTTAAKCSVSITKDLDVTALYKATKEKQKSFYISFLYAVCKIINRHEEFKMCYHWQDDKLILWNEVVPSHLIFHEDSETFTRIWSKWNPNYEGFYDNCMKDIAFGKSFSGYSVPNVPENIFDVSCIPWINYTSMDINLAGEYIYLAPMLTWGKYEEIGNRLLMPFTFEIHHAAADGYHTSKLINDMQALAASSDQWMRP